MREHPLRRARRPSAAISLAALATLLAAAGCGGGTGAADAAGTAAEPPVPRRVRVVTPARLADVEVVREVGTLAPWRRLTVSAEVGGRVIRVGPEVGERIASPDSTTATDPVVIELDRADYDHATRRAQAAVEIAVAELDWARIQERRTRDLFARHIATETDRDHAEIRLRQATAALAQARVAVDAAELARSRTRISAPRGTHVAQRLTERGQVVQAGQPLLVLLRDRRLRLRFQVAARLAPAIAARRDVPVFADGQSVVDRARVVRVGPEADPRTGRIPVEVEVPNPNGRLLVGAVAEVRLELLRSEDPVLAVWRQAVRTELGQTSVASVDDEGKVSIRPVRIRTGAEVPAGLVALTGIERAWRIAIDHVPTLRDGEVVEAVVLPDSATPAPAGTPSGGRDR